MKKTKRIRGYIEIMVNIEVECPYCGIDNFPMDDVLDIGSVKMKCEHCDKTFWGNISKDDIEDEFGVLDYLY